MNKPVKIVKEKYSVEIGYSPEAIEKKLMKFISISGDEFEISAEELSSMLIGGVNSNILEATFVETDRINVVEVGRQIQCVLDRDMKKGEKININYTHPYPIEFALIEESHKIASIKKDVKVFEITKEYLEQVQKKITPKMEEYVEKFYKSFRGVKVGK